MQKNLKLLLLGVMGAIAFSFTGLVVHAGGWDNFKLQHGFISQIIHNQSLEFDDLRKQSVNPETNTRIELTELLNGGPPKDGIPSIDTPQFDTVSASPFPANAPVLGLELNGESVAYPIGILNWHEIVNDTIGGVNVSVTYCPLCDTGIVFDRGATTFGVSGKLYQSCLVMYDRTDDSLFSQPWGLGIVGSQMNQPLQRYPVVKTTLDKWTALHPETKVLSADTGYDRDYFRYPYGTYLTDTNIIFPVRNQQQRSLHPKADITYIWEADSATPFNEFSGESHQFVNAEIRDQGEVQLDFNGRPIRAYWDSELDTVIVTELDGQPLVSSPAFAFVYPAFF
ncbi:DUF3179 domain-containing protein [Oscillatoria sp. CS-180]|uniref:DUF3179 domain-containing protein n=1 Tax=Oscillatoria sp. CS-180 TaxID=3021720 RepID=UPI00232D118C|nr:DUF3179 domain-containing protein [Oscillatoria sp. CS-180]MDB9529396.1 DUF3179 domain-containing protein [Oscillatoria sp. CS-180]